MVAKLDRLARFLPDSRVIVEDFTKRNIKLSLGGSIHDPVGELLFNGLSTVAEFESNLIRAKTHESMQIVKYKRQLRGKQPKFSPAQEKYRLVRLPGKQHISAEISERFGEAGRDVSHRTNNQRKFRIDYIWGPECHSATVLVLLKPA